MALSTNEAALLRELIRSNNFLQSRVHELELVLKAIEIALPGYVVKRFPREFPSPYRQDPINEYRVDSTPGATEWNVPKDPFRDGDEYG